MNEVLLDGFKKSFKAKLIIDIGLFIYFLGTLIYSIVRFGIEQDPLAYNVVSSTVPFIGLVIGSVKLAYVLYKHCTKEQHRMTRVQPLEENYDQDEDFDTDILELVLDILKEIFIYPSVICTMYGFINERAWQFDDAIAGFNFFVFVFSLCFDVVYTKLKYVWAIQKIITSLWYDSETMKCCLFSLLFISHVILFILIHWLILAIIGVRIYVDNFTIYIEIDQGNRSETSGYPAVVSYRMNVDNFSTEGNISETGGYKVAPYTAYMIFCGIYLPVASVVVFIILNRAWFCDEINSTCTCEKMFHFLKDPAAYVAVLFLMPFFIAFCVGIYLHDYDSLEFEVDDNARDTARILGVAFIVIFLLFNIKATVIFAIITVIVGIVVAIFYLIIIVAVLYIIYCICKAHNHDNK